MIEKTQEKIEQLEAAIKHLESVIKHLSYNAGEIKSQIHTSISRHLEAMRNREVWLLSQVDLVVNTKEEVLHHQQVRLNKALGVLQSSLDLVDDDDDGLDSRLADALEKLEISDLKPEETPYITFRADQSALRESIMNYGRVDATGFPLQSAFVAHGHPSTSLPRHFEEYEDAEHHVFYKTVEEVNRARTASNHISVNIPKLSQRPEDWLCRPTTITTPTASAPRFSFPSLSPNNSDWLRNREITSDQTQASLSGNSSIQSWLSQIKQFPDLEDEDFEIIDRDQAGSSTKSSNTVTAFPVMEKTLNSDPFKKLTYPSPVEAWLKSSSRVSEKVREREVLDLFKHISSDQDMWLSSNKETDSCSDCLCYTKATEIENLGNLACTTQTSEWVYRDFSRDMRRWLKRSHDADSADQSVPGSMCKANEPCNTFEDCVCQPNCGAQFSRPDSSPKKWLKTSGSRVRLSSLPKIEGFARYLKSLDTEKEQWLKGSGGRLENMSPEKFPMFDCVSSNLDDWLREKQPGRNKNSPSITDINFEFKHGKEDHNIWLKVTGSQPAQPTTQADPCATWEALQRHVSKLSVDDWLLKQSDDPEDKDNGDEKESTSDKWFLTRCPAPEASMFTKFSPDLGEWLYQKNQ